MPSRAAPRRPSADSAATLEPADGRDPVAGEDAPAPQADAETSSRSRRPRGKATATRRARAAGRAGTGTGTANETVPDDGINDPPRDADADREGVADAAGTGTSADASTSYLASELLPDEAARADGDEDSTDGDAGDEDVARNDGDDRDGEDRGSGVTAAGFGTRTGGDDGRPAAGAAPARPIRSAGSGAGGPAGPSPEETAALARIRAWRDKDPAPGVRLLPTVNVPALAAVRRVLPDRTAARTLAFAYSGALRLTPTASALAAGKAESLAALAERPLREKSALAARLVRRQRWLAGGTGALFGFAGAAGLVADAPALLVLSIAAAVRVGQGYGETVTPTLAISLFALASADTAEEKSRAWAAALAAPEPGRGVQPAAALPPAKGKGGLFDPGDADGTAVDDDALRDGLERAAEREFAKAALSGSLQRLSTTLLARMGSRKLAAALPVIGAVAGGLVNARVIGQLAEASQMVFAARHLQRRGVKGVTAGETMAG